MKRIMVFLIGLAICGVLAPEMILAQKWELSFGVSSKGYPMFTSGKFSRDLRYAKPGETFYTSIRVQDPDGISEVKFSLLGYRGFISCSPTEIKGELKWIKETNLKLVEGDEFSGEWQGSLIIPEKLASAPISDPNWHLIPDDVANVIECEFYAKNKLGKERSLRVWLSYSRYTAVEDKYNKGPSVFTLSQNYPNPFNPRTEISFGLPKDSYVTLTVFNALGQKVATLVNEKRQAGNYRVTWDGTGFPTGIYFYRLESQGFSETKKMLLMK